MSDPRSSAPRERSAEDVVPQTGAAGEGGAKERSSAAGEAGANEEWQAPWVATPEHPQGAADLPRPPQSSTGHYGPGYADPTRHFGGTLPGQPPAAATPSRRAAPGDPSTGSPPQPTTAPVADGQNEGRERPDLRSDEVGFRPPDRVPGEHAPESENAALIFERS